MKTIFDRERFPGRPRILFVGSVESSHTHSWIDLLRNAELNVRLFGLPGGLPPQDAWVPTYITHPSGGRRDPGLQRHLWPVNRVLRLARTGIAHLRYGGTEPLVHRFLADVIRSWQPHVVHTFGIEHAGALYLRVREEYGLADIGKWVLQLRGGSDLQLRHLDPHQAPELGRALASCHQLLSDNDENFRFAAELGMPSDRVSSLGVVPGTGGIDVDAQRDKWAAPPSARRLILWPKAYASRWSKATPVFEALKLCWSDIQPCEVHMLAMDDETRMWYWTLPEAMRRQCRCSERVPRHEVLDLMACARVMLAPSLVDGTPNCMFEAMASGAIPVVSPLSTITSIVKDPTNALFARNLYPTEIASALCRAMGDDRLVDMAASANIELVRRLANRDRIRPKVVAFYEMLAGSSR